MGNKEQLNEEKTLKEVNGGSNTGAWRARAVNLDTGECSQWFGPFNSKEEAIKYVEKHVPLLFTYRYKIEAENIHSL